MKKILTAIVIMTAFLALTGTAFSLPLVASYLDQYLHPKDQDISDQPLDITGYPANPLFDIQKINVYGDSTGFRLDIFTAGYTSPGLLIDGAAIGDLFVDTNGDGTFDYGVALRNHSWSIDAGDGILMGNVFTPTLYRYSQVLGSPVPQYYPKHGSLGLGDHEIATAAGTIMTDQNGNPILVGVTYNGAGLISVSYSGSYSGTLTDWRFHLTQTCGNDVFENTPVPEPATMFLLGSGLIGLAGFARKRFKK